MRWGLIKIDISKYDLTADDIAELFAAKMYSMLSEYLHSKEDILGLELSEIMAIIDHAMNQDPNATIEIMKEFLDKKGDSIAELIDKVTKIVSEYVDNKDIQKSSRATIEIKLSIIVAYTILIHTFKKISEELKDTSITLIKDIEQKFKNA